MIQFTTNYLVITNTKTSGGPGPFFISVLALISPVQCNGSKTENGDGAEEPVQELDGLAQQQCVDPQATSWARIQEHIKGHANQAGTDP